MGTYLESPKPSITPGTQTDYLPLPLPFLQKGVYEFIYARTPERSSDVDERRSLMILMRDKSWIGLRLRLLRLRLNPEQAREGVFW